MMFAFAVIVVLPALFLLEALIVKWFSWALLDVGYVDHMLTYSQACTVSLPLFVMGLIAGALSLFSD